MIKELIKLADALDRMGYGRQVNKLDSLIKSAAEEPWLVDFPEVDIAAEEMGEDDFDFNDPELDTSPDAHSRDLLDQAVNLQRKINENRAAYDALLGPGGTPRGRRNKRRARELNEERMELVKQHSALGRKRSEWMASGGRAGQKQRIGDIGKRLQEREDVRTLTREMGKVDLESGLDYDLSGYRAPSTKPITSTPKGSIMERPSWEADLTSPDIPFMSTGRSGDISDKRWEYDLVNEENLWEGNGSGVGFKVVKTPEITEKNFHRKESYRKSLGRVVTTKNYPGSHAKLLIIARDKYPDLPPEQSRATQPTVWKAGGWTQVRGADGKVMYYIDDKTPPNQLHSIRMPARVQSQAIAQVGSEPLNNVAWVKQ